MIVSAVGEVPLIWASVLYLLSMKLVLSSNPRDATVTKPNSSGLKFYNGVLAEITDLINHFTTKLKYEIKRYVPISLKRYYEMSFGVGRSF